MSQLESPKPVAAAALQAVALADGTSRLRAGTVQTLFRLYPRLEFWKRVPEIPDVLGRRSN